jgi:hypothetical protein
MRQFQTTILTFYIPKLLRIKAQGGLSHIGGTTLRAEQDVSGAGQGGTTISHPRLLGRYVLDPVPI